MKKLSIALIFMLTGCQVNEISKGFNINIEAPIHLDNILVVITHSAYSCFDLTDLFYIPHGGRATRIDYVAAYLMDSDQIIRVPPVKVQVGCSDDKLTESTFIIEVYHPRIKTITKSLGVKEDELNLKISTVNEKDLLKKIDDLFMKSDLEQEPNPYRYALNILLDDYEVYKIYLTRKTYHYKSLKYEIQRNSETTIDWSKNDEYFLNLVNKLNINEQHRKKLCDLIVQSLGSESLILPP